MIKKVAGIIMAMAIILIALVFCGSALLSVDTSGVEGTVHEQTMNTIITIGDASFNLLIVVPVILLVGAFIIVLSLIKTKGSSGRRRKRKRF